MFLKQVHRIFFTLTEVSIDHILCEKGKVICPHLIVFPTLVTNGEGDNPQQTPSVMNVKAAFLGNQEYRLFFLLTDKYVSVSVLQSKFFMLPFAFGHFNTIKYISLQFGKMSLSQPVEAILEIYYANIAEKPSYCTLPELFSF